MAVAAFGMLLTSCQNDIDFVQNAGETSTVSFSVGTPEIATRAYSDGLTAKVLQYAVYDSEGNILSDLTETNATINGSTTVNLQLTTGDSYAVIFWAAAENAPYTVNFNTKTMTVSYDGAKSNDEARDAFYKYHTFTVTGSQTETVELRRPFAQLNIGTSDYTASENAGYVPTTSAVTVKSVYTTLSLVDGAATGETEAVFAANAIPESEQFPVTGYEYLAMNYLLVNSEKEVVDVEFTYADANNDAKTRTVGSVPVQRNHRTNIYGQLLTSDVDINVEIKPGYDDPAHEPDALHLAAAVGGEVTLTENVTLTETLNVQANMVINLNGHTITGPSVARDADNNRVHAIVNNAKLTINGGTITSPADNGGSAIYNNAGATLIVNNVEINGAPLVDGGWPSYGINNYGKMTINGAKVNTYHGGIATGGNGIAIIEDATVDVGLNTQTKQTSWALYIFDNGQMTVNGGTFKNTKNENGQVYGGGYICAISTSKTIINGGTFDKTEGDNNGTGLYYQCTNLEIKGGLFDTNPSAYVADGYTVVETDVDGNTYYSVAPAGNTYENPIVTAEQLKALGNTSVSGTYNLLADIDMVGIDMQPIMLASGANNSLVFNGNGHTIKNLNLVQATQNGMSVAGLFNVLHSGKDITVNDLTIVNATSVSSKYAGVVLAYNSTTAAINFNNVDVDGATIQAETVSPLVSYTTGPVNLTNCDVKNISMTGEKPEKIGAFVGTANQASCVVTANNCTNDSEYKVAGRVINGATMTIDGQNYVTTTDALNQALAEGAETIILPAGEYSADLGDATSRTLTIIGTEGTAVQFENLGGQNSLPLNKLDSLTIRDCKIGKMLTKNWGMLVFGSSNNENGVYTIENCTFDGVGTQGIYINEYTSGATYNIINCTFNGNFGNEGAVTIQNNTGVNHTVNVKGCTFNNVDAGHQIYIIGNYNGWTLNTDATTDVNWSGANPNI